MQHHAFVGSDESQFDGNCAICGGKERDSIHRTEQQVREYLDGFVERMRAARQADKAGRSETMTTTTRPKIVAMVTDQGTAAAETAICEDCASPARVLERLDACLSDVDRRRGFVDVSENEAIQCRYCGVYGGEEEEVEPCLS
jgi:hypothetical protein